MFSSNSIYIFLKCFVFFVFVKQIAGDYYSSVVGLEKLISMEEHFITAVENYISDVEKIHSEIESFLDQIEFEHETFNNSDANYYDKPMNAFKIIKRFVVDWKNYDDNIEVAFKAFNDTVTKLESNYIKPNASDLLGAARGISVLQNMYKLDVDKLARGYILDKKYSEGLTAHDSFILGANLYGSSEFLPASEWFIQALKQMDDKANDGKEVLAREFPLISYVDILKYLRDSLFHGGSLKLVKHINRQLEHYDPKNTTGWLGNKELFDSAETKERRLRRIQKQPKKSEIETLYAELCSGTLTQTDAELRPLRCRYVTNDVPYYFIGPFKMEELHHDPFVAFYHQTIYESEIEQIRKVIGNKVERSKVNGNEYTQHRVSKQSWLRWNEHMFMKKMYQRLEDITGLSMVTSEPMQVANYGIGGHFVPHYDFFPISNANGFEENRILTAKYYISDVELGGATAFPFLRLAVPPIKYSLVMWYNMHDSTEVDYHTFHAGCPVLKGSKWIGNVWFTDLGQEFKRSCGLQLVGDKYNYLNPN